MPDPGSVPLALRSDFSFGWLKKMRKTDEFSSVFRLRCIFSLTGIDFLAAPNGLGYARLGLIVPKKIIATAVHRNRVKRLIREHFRLSQGELIGLDVVARIKSRTDEAKLIKALRHGLSHCKSCLTTCSKPPAQGANNQVV